jgi:hypothetical protein
MNLLWQLLSASALIAIFVLLRLYADSAVIRDRLARRGDTDCDSTKCLHGCAVAVDRKNEQTRT